MASKHTAAPDLLRERVVAALLVGCVVILLGYASGLGLSSVSTAVGATQTPQLSASAPPPAVAAATPAARPAISYVAVAVAAPPSSTTPPIATVPSTASPTSTSPAPPVTSPGSAAPPPSLAPPAPPACGAGLFDALLLLLSKQLDAGAGLLVGVVDSVLGVVDLPKLAALTSTQRAADVRAVLAGPLRTSVPSGQYAATSTACTTRLNLLTTLVRTP